MQIKLRLLILGLVVFILQNTSLNAQNIKSIGFNYQAVARDIAGDPIGDKEITVEISIRKGSATGALIWQESHQVKTNRFGLFSLKAGTGSSTGFGMADAFSDIDWSTADYFSEVRADFGNGLLSMGNVQLQALPYAMVADTALSSPRFAIEELTNVDTSKIKVNDYLAWNGSTWEPYNNDGEFDELRTKINSDSAALHGLINTNQTNISTNASNLSSLETELDADSAALHGLINTNQTNISTNASNLSSLETELDADSAALHGLINTNQTNISTNASNLSSLETELDADSAALHGLINTNQTNISTNASNLSSLETELDADSAALHGLINTNQTNISTNASNLSSLETELDADSAALHGLINTNQTNISTNASNLSALETELDADSAALHGLINTNQTNISTNASNLSSLETELDADSAALHGLINTNQTNISTNASNLSSLETELDADSAALHGLINTNQTNISTNASNLSSLETELDADSAALHGLINTNQTNISTNASNLSSLETELDADSAALHGLINTNQTNISTNASNLSSLETELDADSAALHGLINTNQTNISTNASNLSSLETELDADSAALHGLINTNQTNISTNASNLSSLETELDADSAALHGLINTNQTNISTNASDLSALETELDADSTALKGYIDSKLTISNNLSDVSNAGTARTNLGVAIGSDVQAYDADLDDLADGSLTATKIGGGTVDNTEFGYLNGVTSAVQTQLDAKQASDAQLDDVAGLTPTDGNIIVGDGSNFVAESGATARTSLGVAIGSDVQAYDADLADLADGSLTATKIGGGTVDNTEFGYLNGVTSAIQTQLDAKGTGDLLSTNNLSDVSNAGTARTNLGVAIGSDVQAYDAQLDDVAGLTPTDGNIIVGDGSNFVAESGVTARTSLGVAIGSDVQAYDADLADLADGSLTATKIGGGTVDNTEFGYLNGVTSAIQTQLDAKGTGDLLSTNNLSDVSNAGTARTNLGVAIGSDVQAYDAQLDDVAGLTPTDGNIIVGDGSNFVAESGATARTSLGVAIGSDVQAYDADLDDLADGSLTATKIGSGTIDNTEFGYLNGVTSAIQTQLDAKGTGDLLSTNNLSDVSNAGTARTNLGVAIGSDVQAYDAQLDDVAGLTPTDGNIIVGDGSNFVAESGATARTSLGVAIGSDVQAYDADLDDLADGSLTATKIGSGTIDNTEFGYLNGVTSAIQTQLDAKGTGDLLSTNNLSDVSNAGTARTNLGVAIGSDVQAYDAQLDDVAGLTPTDGNIIVGDGSNFVAESGATARTSLGVAIGSDVQAYDADLADLADGSLTATKIGGGTVDNTEFGYLNGVTSAVQTQLDAKQASDAQLDDVAGLTPTDGNIIVGDGSNFVAESGATARTSLGVAIGSDVQAYDADLADLADGSLTATKIGGGTVDNTEFGYLNGVTSAIQTQLDAKGTGDLLSTNNLSDVSNASTARTNLGVAIGSDVQAYDADLADLADGSLTATKIGGGTVDNTEFGYLNGVTSAVQTQLDAKQAYDAQLDDVAGLTPTDGNIIVGDGSNFVAESGATARTSLGVAIGSDVQAYDADLDDLADGSLTATKIGSGTIDNTEFGYLNGVTSAIQTQLDAKQASDAQLDDVAGLTPTDGNIIVGDGSNFVAESGATARTSLGVAIGSDVQAYDADLDDLADGELTATKVENGTYMISSAGTNGQVWTSDGSGAGAWTTLSTLTFKDGGTNFSNSMLIGHNTTGTLSSASNNLGVGPNTLSSITSGTANTAVGYKAMEDNTTGYSNVAVGETAMESNTTGYANVAVGEAALDANTTGKANVAVGQRSLSNNTTGFNNVAVGRSALEATTEGEKNVAIGYETLESNTTGDMNIGFGHQTLGTNTTGQHNVAIGHQAGFSVNTGDDNVFLGYQAGYSETGSNKLYIDNSSTATPLIYGNFSSDALTINGTLSSTGKITSDNNLDIKNGSTSAGKLNIFEDSDDGSNKVIITSPTLASNYTLTLPSDDGSASQVLTTDGSGNLSWVTVQASDAQLDDVAGLTPTDGNIVIGDGSNFVTESGATARTSLGVAIGTDVQAYDADLADLADGTLTATKVENGSYMISSAGTSGEVWTSDGAGAGAWSSISSIDNALTINESGAAVDVRMEGDTKTHLFFLDGSADKIGIGTSSPTSVLHVVGDETLNSIAKSSRLIVGGQTSAGDAMIHLQESDNGWNFRHQASDNSFRMSNVLGGTDHVVIDENGYFGIGNTSPNSPLDVTGNTELDGAVTINESSASVDFRVESNSNTHMLFVDGSADAIGINASSIDNTLQIGSEYVAGAGYGLQVNDADYGVAVSFSQASAGVGLIIDNFQDGNDNVTMLSLRDNNGSNTLFEIEGSGEVGIGTATPSSALEVVGNIEVQNGSTSAGTMQFFEDSDDGSNKVTIQAQAMGADYTLTLPTDNGSASQVLTTDGNGSLSWSSVQASNSQLNAGSDNLSLSSDAITVTKSYHVLAAESGTTDDCATISGGSIGDMLYLSADAGDVITIKDGTGNINCGSDRSLTGNNGDIIHLIYDGSNWNMVTYSNN